MSRTGVQINKHTSVKRSEHVENAVVINHRILNQHYSFRLTKEELQRIIAVMEE